MTAQRLDERIQKHEEKLKQLKAQQQALQAREKKKLADQQRSDDTRRKILLGAYMLKKMGDSDFEKQKILAELNEYLVEQRDRRLFEI
jgi:uncharacterized protein (DUF342 family)